MNILLVEDSVERIVLFYQALQKHNFVVATSADAAIPLVESVPFDLIYLDYDLGGRVFVPIKDTNTGYRVAQALRGHSCNEGATVVVHSMNPVGSCACRDLLTNGGYEVYLHPFGTFVIESLTQSIMKKRMTKKKEKADETASV